MSTTILLTTILVLLAISTVDALRFRLRQKEIQKHDRVLLPFCQLRRDVMCFLYREIIESADSLSPAQYRYIRRLLNVLDDTICSYDHYKISPFNVRMMARHLEIYQKVSKTASKTPDHPEIWEFHARFRELWVKALLTCTPLIRWEPVLRLMIFAYYIGYTAGEQEARWREAEHVMKSAGEVREDARRYNVSLRCA